MDKKVIFENNNLQEKLNITSSNELLLWRGEHHNNVLHLLVSKKEIALFKKLEKALSFSQIKSFIMQNNELGDTPLHLAVWTGQIEFVNLFSQYLDNVDLQDNKKRTPLMLAIKNNNKLLIKVLLNKTNNINLQDCLGKTSLHYSSDYADKVVYEQLIIAGSNSDITDLSDTVAQCPIKINNNHQSSVADIVNITKKQRF